MLFRLNRATYELSTAFRKHDVQGRSAQILCATSLWLPNFVGWRLIFVGPQYGNLLHVTILAPRCLENILT